MRVNSLDPFSYTMRQDQILTWFCRLGNWGRERHKEVMKQVCGKTRIWYYVILCQNLFYFIVMLDGVALWHLQMFLRYIKYIIFQFIPSTVLFYHLSPHFWNSFNKYLFSIYIYVYTIFVPYSFSYILSLPPPSPLTGMDTPRQDLFFPPVLWFCKRKESEWLLFV
jgi:hypothetical protein